MTVQPACARTPKLTAVPHSQQCAGQRGRPSGAAPMERRLKGATTTQCGSGSSMRERVWPDARAPPPPMVPGCCSRTSPAAASGLCGSSLRTRRDRRVASSVCTVCCGQVTTLHRQLALRALAPPGGVQEVRQHLHGRPGALARLAPRPEAAALCGGGRGAGWAAQAERAQLLLVGLDTLAPRFLILVLVRRTHAAALLVRAAVASGVRAQAVP
jgi:hypothetical protein